MIGTSGWTVVDRAREAETARMVALVVRAHRGGDDGEGRDEEDDGEEEREEETTVRRDGRLRPFVG